MTFQCGCCVRVKLLDGRDHDDDEWGIDEPEQECWEDFWEASPPPWVDSHVSESGI